MTFIFLGLWAYIALSVRYFDRYLKAPLPAWGRFPGVILMVFGFLTGISSVLTFLIIGRGTPAPLDPPKQFVAVGPYQFVRNPMYFGGWVLLEGLALYQRSFAILLFAFLWVGVVHILLIRLEEPGLRKRFGQSYNDYCQKIPRWIPRLGR
jgi:protein-S-isoprenylcysteine O-methyltransferase Ste14